MNDYSVSLLDTGGDRGRYTKFKAFVCDLLVAITTSGQSDNVSVAVETALEMGIQVIALTGKDGGKLAPLIANKGLELRVPSAVTARIQEAHAIIIHCICDLVELHTAGKLML